MRQSKVQTRQVHTRLSTQLNARQGTPLDTRLGRAAVQIFAANERMNQVLIEHLDPAAWRAKPPGKARTIVAIFTHMHNVRTKWVRLTAPRSEERRVGKEWSSRASSWP